MISIRNLSKRYGSTQAVDDLSFDVRPGIVTGFLGPNGAGKSSTMRMLLGLDHPDRGTATIAGKPYADLAAPARKIGALLDGAAVQGNRTARKHLTWVAQAAGLPRKRVDEVLDLVGLTDVAGRKVDGFSLGMRQRLGIGVALLGDPEVLLLDEPVNGLDTDGIRTIRTLMRSLAHEGRTVFVSSHLMSEMEETAEHVIVIGGGKLVADAPISELKERSTSTHVRAASPHSTELADVLQRAGATVTRADDGTLHIHGMPARQVGDLAWEHRLGLHELATQHATLERAFLDLTHDSVTYRSGRLDENERAATTRRTATEE